VSHESNHHPVSHAYAGYWDRAQWPLQGLYFLMPLLVLYELGTLWLAPEGSERLPPILAESLLGIGFEKLGVTGVYLPAIIVVVVLSCMHLVRRDPWRPELKLYAVMWAETFAWALPLFVFSMVLVRELSGSAGELQAVAGSLPVADAVASQWKDDLVFSVGAGIYEELLFRLIGIALLHMLMVDVLALPEKYGGGATIVLSALAFALYHFVKTKPDSWIGYTLEGVDLGDFAFFTLAGVYLAMIYVIRGFGLVVGTHALYDVMVVCHNNDLTARVMGWFGVN
jgi:membrane protease YdiL (CAAX protease family)